MSNKGCGGEDYRNLSRINDGNGNDTVAVGIAVVVVDVVSIVEQVFVVGVIDVIVAGAIHFVMIVPGIRGGRLEPIVAWTVLSWFELK